MARLRLRPLTSADADAVFGLLADERVVRYMLFPIFTRERAAAFAARAERTPDPGVTMDAILACVVDDGDRVAGLCGVVVDAASHRGEIWYLLEPDSWGRGLMTEAVGALVSHAFASLGLEGLWATCVPQNPASARVLQKAGFARDPARRAQVCIHGTTQDADYYELSRARWQERHA